MEFKDFVDGDKVRVLVSCSLLTGVVKKTISEKSIKVFIPESHLMAHAKIKMCKMNEVAKFDERICVVRSWKGKSNRGHCFIDREKYPDFFMKAELIPTHHWLYEYDGKLEMTKKTYFEKMKQIVEATCEKDANVVSLRDTAL